MARGFRGRRTAVGRSRPQRWTRGRRRGDKVDQGAPRTSQRATRVSPLPTAPSPASTNRGMPPIGSTRAAHAGMSNHHIHASALLAFRYTPCTAESSGPAWMPLMNRAALNHLFTVCYHIPGPGESRIHRTVDCHPVRQESCQRLNRIFAYVVGVREAT